MAEAAAVKLLKGAVSVSGFSRGGPVRSEHHCQFGCTQGTPGTYRETQSCWSESQGETHSVQKSQRDLLFPVEPSSYQCAGHRAAIAQTSSGWITKVAPPREFTETLPPPTPSPVFYGRSWTCTEQRNLSHPASTLQPSLTKGTLYWSRVCFLAYLVPRFLHFCVLWFFVFCFFLDDDFAI